MDRIFNTWPTVADMARDLGENPVTVRSWRQRGSIPAKYDLAIVRMARERGGELTLEDLAHLRSGASSVAEEAGAPTK